MPLRHHSHPHQEVIKKAIGLGSYLKLGLGIGFTMFCINFLPLSKQNEMTNLVLVKCMELKLPSQILYIWQIPIGHFTWNFWKWTTIEHVIFCFFRRSLVTNSKPLSIFFSFLLGQNIVLLLLIPCSLFIIP